MWYKVDRQTPRLILQHVELRPDPFGHQHTEKHVDLSQGDYVNAFCSTASAAYLNKYKPKIITKRFEISISRHKINLMYTSFSCEIRKSQTCQISASPITATLHSSFEPESPQLRLK